LVSRDKMNPQFCTYRPKNKKYLRIALELSNWVASLPGGGGMEKKITKPKRKKLGVNGSPLLRQGKGRYLTDRKGVTKKKAKLFGGRGEKKKERKKGEVGRTDHDIKKGPAFAFHPGDEARGGGVKTTQAIEWKIRRGQRSGLSVGVVPSGE